MGRPCLRSRSANLVSGSSPTIVPRRSTTPTRESQLYSWTSDSPTDAGSVAWVISRGASSSIQSSPLSAYRNDTLSWITRRTPASRAASSTRRTPSVRNRSLMRHAPGRSAVSPTGTWVAKLQTASAPSNIATIPSWSSRLVRTALAPASANCCAFSGVRAIPTTSCPARTSSVTAAEPITPVAPVTATLTEGPFMIHMSPHHRVPCPPAPPGTDDRHPLTDSVWDNEGVTATRSPRKTGKSWCQTFGERTIPGHLAVAQDPSRRPMPPRSAQGGVQIHGLRGDRVPGERRHGTFPPSPPVSRREIGIAGQPVDALGDAAFEAGRVVGVVRHDEPGLAVEHDLRDTSDAAGHHGGLTRHRFQVHDPERLVDRRAEERQRTGQHLADFLARQHLRDDEDAVAAPLEVGDCGVGLRLELGGVRGAREKHDLQTRVEGETGAQQVRDTLLSRDAADEGDVRAGKVDADPLQHRRVGVGSVEVGVDAVVDHVQPVFVEARVAAEDVGAHAVADCDDRVRRLVGRALCPRRDSVPTAELLGLPRTLRFETVRGHDMRHVVEELGPVPGHVGIPGVRVCD